MAPLVFLDRLVLLTQIFSSLPPTEIAATGGRRIGLPSDPRPEINQNPNIAGSPRGSAPPFSNSESSKPSSLSSEILFPAASTTSSSAPASSTATARTSFHSNSRAEASPSAPLLTLEPNATLACEIYQAYTSLCPPTTVNPYTTSFLNKPYIVDDSAVSELASSARASCLCYPSSYYVSYVYDDAAFACAGYTNDANNSTSAAVSFTSAATTATTQTEGFCSSIGNIRLDASSAPFGQYTAATPTPTPTSTPSATATGGGRTSAARRSYKAKGGVWAAAAAVVALAILI
ncbi:hypothetical protein MMC29_003026 [Sticta canariensis]|nr:hypothetical protein [Sticta canariensis]